MLQALEFGRGKAITVVMSLESIKLFAIGGCKKIGEKGVDDIQFDPIAFIFNINVSLVV